jgi:hypothetical protein
LAVGGWQLAKAGRESIYSAVKKHEKRKNKKKNVPSP